MPKKIKIVGLKFGKLIVIKKVGSDKKYQVLWECLCDCGKITIVTGINLRRGNTKSCGCLNIERLKGLRTHGMSRTPTYGSWKGLINRCNNKDCKSYQYYGARGIKVCKRWLKFENFFKDMGEKPKGLTIERVNNNKGYSPDNCKWATYTEQQRNKRLNKNNKTGVSGVSWCKLSQKYVAQIKVNSKSIFIGSFKTIKTAETARKLAELKYWDSSKGGR